MTSRGRLGSFFWSGACAGAIAVSILVGACVLAQVPLDEKEETKPPKLRTDLPLLPPLEILAKGTVPPLGDLLLEAEQVQHPALRDLLLRLGHPHDRLMLPDGKWLRVAPLARRLESEKSPQLKVQVVSATGQVESQRTVAREEVQRIEYFENFALQEALRLAQEAEKLQPPLRRSQVLQVAERIASQVRLFHAEAQRYGMRAEGWQGVEAQLRQEERKIRIECLNALQQEERLEEAARWADRLLELYPGDAEMAEHFRRLTEATGERAIAREDFAAVRRALDRLRNRLPGATSPTIERFQRVLDEHAQMHLKQAQQLQAKGELVPAWFTGAEAARLVPNWERVRLFQRQLLKHYPFLIVGVPELPRTTRPDEAVGLSDQMTVALLYEWLVEPEQPPFILGGYWSSCGLVPFRDQGAWVLAQPAHAVLAFSENGKRPINWQDVRFSVEYAGLPTHIYYDPRWDRRWAHWQWQEDSLGQLRLRREYPPWDALQLLSVPLLVASAEQGAASKPLTGPLRDAKPARLEGTGPFILAQRSETEWVFRPRPDWSRAHAHAGPILREIRLRRYSDVRRAHEDLECGAVHLVVGLTARDADTFVNIPHARTVCLARQQAAPTGMPFTPRVAMLVFNRRRVTVSQTELRQAIGAAIDRESLLRNFLRGRDPTTYRVSGGPVPLGSWAYHPDYSPVRRSPYRPALARELFTRLRSATPATGPNTKDGANASALAQPLSLWVVAEEPCSAQIAQGLADQLAVYGVKLQTRLVPRQELLAVWARGESPYDILLWVAEYPHEGITPFRWLTPAPAGHIWPNPFGLADEPMVAQLRQRYLQAADLPALRNILHQLHAHLVEQAWVVPLWEVDSFLAVWQSLQVSRFHPLWVLHHVETWLWN